MDTRLTDVIEACGRHDLQQATVAALERWADAGVPNRFYLLGSERLAPEGLWTWSNRRTGAELLDEELIRDQIREDGVIREEVFVRFLLRAALAHVYFWKKLRPEMRGVIVPDPVLLDRVIRKYEEVGDPLIYLEKVAREVRAIPGRALEDVEHPLPTTEWYISAEFWINPTWLYGVV